MTSKGSRLDRQVVLLETGSTQVVRNLAADQLGELAKNHPEDILNLLSRVYPFLLNKKWETRISSAKAIGNIVQYLPDWNPDREDLDADMKPEFEEKVKEEIKEEPNDNLEQKEQQASVKEEIDELNGDGINAMVKIEQDLYKNIEKLKNTELWEKIYEMENDLIKIDNFDIMKVLEQGKPLLAADINSIKDPNDIKAQKKVKLVEREESAPSPTSLSNTASPTNEDQKNLASSLKREPSPMENQKSARMKAMAKRKLKRQTQSSQTNQSNSKPSVDLKSHKLNDLNNNDKVIDGTTHKNGNDSVLSEKTTFSNPKMDITQQNNENKIMIESAITNNEDETYGITWSLQTLYDLLIENLNHQDWYIRHGAALGLREIFIKNKKSGKLVGKLKTNTIEENNIRNNKYLQDLCCKLLQVLALDRFGDFVNDTVVAPVRESCAQTLAAAMNSIDYTIFAENKHIFFKVFENLKQLILQQHKDDTDDDGESVQKKIWQASHGGLLGLLYFVGSKTAFFIENDLLEQVVEIVLFGLNSHDDDVQSVASAILLPITNSFIGLQTEIIDLVLMTLWNCIIHRDDDLSSSIGPIMDLLNKLFDHAKIVELMKLKFKENDKKWSFHNLVPHLYPFLRHSITLVRKSVLNLLLRFLSIHDDFSNDNWIDGKSFRLLFQNILFEQNKEINALSVEVYTAMINQYVHQSDVDADPIDSVFGNFIPSFVHLLMTPIGEMGKNFQMTASHILKPSSTYVLPEDHATKKRRRSDANASSPIGASSRSSSICSSSKVNIDSAMINGDVEILGKEIIIYTRVKASEMLGFTLSKFTEKTQRSFIENVLTNSLKIPFSTPKFLVAVIISEFAKTSKQNGGPDFLLPQWLVEIYEPIFMRGLTNDPNVEFPTFRELVPALKGLRTQCQTLLNTFASAGKLNSSKIPQLPFIVKGEPQAGNEAFDMVIADKVYSDYYDKLFKHLDNTHKIKALKTLQDSRYRVLKNMESVKESYQSKQSSILANYANALLEIRYDLPVKLNPFIRSLMDNVKSEQFEVLQKRSSNAIIQLIIKLIANKKENVANKIVKNLCAFLCVDSIAVPEFNENSSFKDQILTTIIVERNNSISDDAKLKEVSEKAKIKTRGALFTLQILLSDFGKDSFVKVPQLKSIIFDPLQKYDQLSTDHNTETMSAQLGSNIVDSLGVLRIIFPFIHKELQEKELVSKVLPTLVALLVNEYSVLRFSSALTFAILAKELPVLVLPFILKNVLPFVNNAGSTKERQGGVELIHHLAEQMDSDILPYVVFFIVPLLGRMSDSDTDVRDIATKTFASIIKLVPLEEGIKDPEGLSQEFMEGRERERDFLQQMMDPAKAKPFKLPVAVNATLRKYQQEGVNWLAFLNKYHLHGILCDDMGLGKTLQTICIIASDHYMRAEDYQKTKSVETRPLPSLIVCPPSLTGHWEQEFNQYSPGLKVLVYAGSPSIRQTLRNSFNKCSIVVTSYDVVRNDLDVIKHYNYNYCVLDEGHIIKNSNSKLSSSVKEIRANHRLILSGTPIQNNVLELWSLFDFLMPGFLGTQKAFQEKYSKPIVQSRNAKSSSKEQERGVLALEALHKQVLPFMLRRLKDDVLSDLPPKIIQDYYCDLSDLQKQLYQDFTKKQKKSVEMELDDNNGDATEPKQHIFQALQYMRKLCNHPSLVLTSSHPQYSQAMQYLKATHMDIHDIAHAPKLGALRNLLLECGIGLEDVEKDNNLSTATVISQHRVLVFCQLKDMLDIIENDLFKKNMPSVSYMRLDRSVDSRDRQSVVRKFNEDPSIDVLLLSTKVGGLGLNLTGADTVIFVEHDWNPMNDLQAMDRAHRLGQKKVVNVYRIITKGTLEEKIMGLQKFKMNIASTVVNQQNAGLSSMDTHQLLDLFDSTNVKSSNENGVEAGDAKKNGLNDDIVDESGLSGKAKAAMGDLVELWDEKQYEDEYNLDNFIKNLK